MKKVLFLVAFVISTFVFFNACSDDDDSKSLPVVSVMEIENVSANSAKVVSNIQSDGGSPILSYGVCWDVNTSPGLDNIFKEGLDKDQDGNFSIDLAALEAGTEYYVRAYAVNEVGVSYSDELTFITDEGVVKSILIEDVTDVTYESASVIAQLIVNENFSVSEFGVCWDTEEMPDVNGNLITGSEISTTGQFIIDLMALESNTEYFVRAYAIVDDEHYYGEDYSFTTLEAVAPIVGDAEVLEVAAISAKISAVIEDDMGIAVISRGVCWNTTGEPTLEDSYTENGEGVGDFIAEITGLNSSTTYYVRVYATNDAGTSYGEEFTIETEQADLARVFAGGIESKTGITANYLGRVSNDGGSPVTSRGVCWGTEPNPTIDGDSVEEGEGTGTFRTRIQWLEANTEYYVRGYAINSEGVSYGPEITFKTNSANITYTLHRSANPTEDELDAYNRITVAMDEALYYYNKYTAFEKHLNIYYNPGVPTADGNFNGTIRFGNKNTMQKVTAMHEISHTLGVGTTNHWRNNLIVGGVYQGANALAKLRYLTGNASANLNGDNAHFWPYGLNFYSEYNSENDLIFHCKIVYAMTLDGLGNW